MGFVKKIFSRPKAQSAQQVTQQIQQTPTPTIDQAAQNAEDEMRMRRRKGRRAYQTGASQAAPPVTGQKSLLGQ